MFIVNFLDVFRDIWILNDHSLRQSKHIVIENGSQILVGSVLRLLGGQVTLGPMNRVTGIKLTIVFQIEITARDQVGTRTANDIVYERALGFYVLGNTS